ncbi:MAG: lipopolysaccharide transport periplasmic protein LptA [Marivivens sp.]|jgi:lipopolysaccharide export system protein LptA|uniref:lipopolysaccharide transport periplasmic protein LptA n=1 Tax=Marivivens sp. TaxID=1978374 RepID=UPI00201F48B5|nr:lipopolysaccharide transport periplasmic protein LptA [Marivivens sp.]MCL7404467.1 lipopolysaccharide transport periplasmic protein LptA [Marivivens geojensis]NBQ49027.1 lipopolysaccharide transport periplasmic protein LptA [Marivivens sp.]NBT50038.1 lipopolysaccharide transport periplasmic protein LptA [Marivivens sp.]NBX09470.1 lipopolysaccharide transport periplasmic protein LptA [Marivivens sp.]NCW66967.1 lipopolysaccharide transport periplasmic protein LptA [Marivivens sp.]
MSLKRGYLFALSLLLAPPAIAQTNIALDGFSADATAPVEIASESLTVNRESGSAVFTGDVVIAQGKLRLSAESVEVIYLEASGDISRLLAEGHVIFVTENDAAQSDQAEYNLTDRRLVMTGNVILTQGASTIASDRMTVNLDTGEAQLDGRVRTTLTQQDNN